MKVKVLGNKILVKQVEEKKEEKQGSLYLPTTTTSDKIVQGEIILAGKGLPNIEMTAKEGDIIYFAKGAGIPIRHEGVEYRLMTEDTILLLEPKGKK